MKLIPVGSSKHCPSIFRSLAASLLLGLLAAVLMAGMGASASAKPIPCNGDISPQKMRLGGGTAEGQQDDLLVDTPDCKIDKAGSYFFNNINIVANGKLTIEEPPGDGSQVNLWVRNIIVENGGSLIAGTAKVPYGSRGGTLTIYIYGADQSKGKDPAVAANAGTGAFCNGKLVTDTSGPCGIDWNLWNDNGKSQQAKVGGDYFYQYGPMYGDNKCSNGSIWNPKDLCGTGEVGYFGYKVLAVSYGGTLNLFGYKGTPLPKAAPTRLFHGFFHGFQGFFGGNGGFNSQGTFNAPRTLGAAAAPEKGNNSFKDVFLAWVKAHQGGNGGGGGGGGHGGGGQGGGGSDAADIDNDPRSSGYSWLRLAGDLTAKDNPTTLNLSIAANDTLWNANRWWMTTDKDNLDNPDQIVVTTTDYLPGHSDKLTVSKVVGNTVTFTDSVKWDHRGTKFLIKSRLGDEKARFLKAGMDPDLIENGAELRAAVALLTRSIRIVSAGDTPCTTFDKPIADKKECPDPQIVPGNYYFGAHTVFRQGFKQIQIQGVEFADLGQGGKLGHYPLHFHMARKVPTDTFIKDSTINESMTRWIVLHSTQGVLLQRNVGYKSIGHGFYLESGTETDNKFYSNLGIFSRAAVENAQNPRKVPGILAYTANNQFQPNKEKPPKTTDLPGDPFPWRTDFQHPTVFWITNGWNEFVGNMAAGAGACGAAYWLIPAWNSDMVDVPTAQNQEFGMHMKWTGYAALQRSSEYAGSTPLKLFFGNFATSTMTSFQTVAVTTQCFGADYPGDPAANNPGHFKAVPSFAPQPKPGDSIDDDMYYPHVGGGGRLATLCKVTDGKDDCSDFTPSRKPNALGPCTHGDALPSCAVIALDHFTSSFHWAETNFSAIWLRPYWYLVSNLVLTDVQNGGISLISSGTYDRSGAIDGLWSVVRDSVFIGNSQNNPNNPSTASSGPFMNGIAKSANCENGTPPTQSCLVKDEGMSMPLSNFGTGQRLFSIYDGPAYQESNIYLDIQKSDCDNCMYSGTLGFRKQIPDMNNKKQFSCYLPNAAIGWKQPNGFFYPPSFHSSNLFFDKVDIRHYVIDALFKPGGFLEDKDKVEDQYCQPKTLASYPDFFSNFTDIDRQTELNDDDGTLTGLTNNQKSPEAGTISVNPADFFNAPVETPECLSNLGVTAALACPPKDTPTAVTAKTSPYDYVTTAIFPGCAIGDKGSSDGRCGSSIGDTLVSQPPPRFSKNNGRGGSWSQECTNPACYGVPLYRQYLTGVDGGDAAKSSDEVKTWYKNHCNDDKTAAACRFPFVRMGGQSTYQRSTLTVNHGTFFLDTTASENLQQHKENFSFVTNCDDTPAGKACSQRSVNVFQNGGTYYMFFLYAKRTTRQTYQIYVGQNFTYDLTYSKDAPTGMLRAIRPALTSMPVPTYKTIAWPSRWTVNYNNTEACRNSTPSCGILEITVDFSSPDLKDMDPLPKNGLCEPHKFCTASGNSCGCALGDDDLMVKADPATTKGGVSYAGFKGQCQAACSVWAVKDLDFPDDGPYGFSFTLPASPSDFTADDKGQLHRPVPETFTGQKTEPNFNWLSFQFVKTSISPDGDKGSLCYYDPAKLPGTKACLP